MEPRVHPALHIDVFTTGGLRLAEEMFNRRRHISVGRAPHNTIVLPDENAPPSLPLFHRSRSSYALHYDEGLHGYVRRNDDQPWQELSELHDASSPRHHGYDLELEPGTRGRIELGDETLVFKLIPGPEPLPLPSRWRSVTVALAVTLALAGVLSWMFLRPVRAPVPHPPAAEPAATPPAAEITPTPPINVLPAITVERRMEPARHAAPRAAASRRHAEVALTGSLRSVGPFPYPKIDLVSTPPRSAERAAGPRSALTPDGLLTPETVVHAIDEEKGALLASYERALRENPRLEGEVVARMLISRDGRVARVLVVSDTLESIAVRRRLESLLGGWRAPLPTAASAEYELPFVFRATEPRPRR